MPQRGWTETFDERIRPERARLAVYFAAAGHRAQRYPDLEDGDAFERRAAWMKKQVWVEYNSQPIRC
ncbi:hypothetical protein [Streptomyces sp. NPDC091371]|uniref:hypothetical protein n=1 Tax=Streptomyces sp. NPDC091371 TaxID=3155303 RepID=UPI0034433228